MEIARRLTASIKIKVYGGKSMYDFFEIAISTSRILQARPMCIRDGKSMLTVSQQRLLVVRTKVMNMLRINYMYGSFVGKCDWARISAE